MWEDRDGSEILKRLHHYSARAFGWRDLAIMGTWYATGSRDVDGYDGNRRSLAQDVWRQAALLRWGDVTPEGDAWLPLGADPSMLPEQFAELAESNDVTTRILVASNPGTPSPLLVGLAGDADPVVRARCWANPSVPRDAWDAFRPLVVAEPEYAATRRWNDPVDPQANEADIRAAVAAGPATPLEVLIQLEGDPDEYVRECLRANALRWPPIRPPRGPRHWFGPAFPYYMRVQRQGAPFRIDFGWDIDDLPGAIRLSDDKGWSEISYAEYDGDPDLIFIETIDKVLAGAPHVQMSCYKHSGDLVYWSFDRLPDGMIHMTVGEEPPGPFVFETTQSPDAFRAALGRPPSTHPVNSTGASADPLPVPTAEADRAPEDLIDDIDDPIWLEMLDAAEQFDFVEAVEFVDEDPPWINAPTSREW